MIFFFRGREESRATISGSKVLSCSRLRTRNACDITVRDSESFINLEKCTYTISNFTVYFL